MVCEAWKEKLDTYLDGELPENEMRTLDAHVRSCPSCSADALARVQMKRAIHVVGKRFAANPDFRTRIQQSVAAKPQRSLRMAWVFVAAAVLLGAVFSLTYIERRSSQAHIFSEVADLHVATLASSSPVDVISTDRHTVKPWFQGKIPFAFNLPEIQNTEFTLVGGRVSYLDQAPGAHLIYDIRKHHISVFIFREESLPRTLPAGYGSPKGLNFSMQTWSKDGLRYFVIGDASPADIDGLAALFKAG